VLKGPTIGGRGGVYLCESRSLDWCYLLMVFLD
jgi:hypothetical protein